MFVVVRVVVVVAVVIVNVVSVVSQAVNWLVTCLCLLVIRLIFFLLSPLVCLSSSHFRSHPHILMQATSAVAHLQRSHLPVLQEQVVTNFSRSTDDTTANQQGTNPRFASNTQPHSFGSGSCKSDRHSCHT